MVSKASSGRGRGVKEKRSDVSNIEVVKDGAVPFVTGDSGNAAMEVELPFMVDEIAVKDKQCPVMNTTGIGSYPPLPTQVTSSAGNAPGGNRIDVVILGKYGLVRSMFSSSTGLFSFQFSSMDGLDATLENGPWFIQNNPLILKKWHPNENLLKEDVSTILVWVKIHGVPVTAFSEDGLSGRSSYTRAMIELRADVELKDNIVVAMPKTKGADEKKTLKRPGQTSRGVPMGPKIGLNLIKIINMFPKSLLLALAVIRRKVWNLLSRATSSGSFFMNVDNSSTSTTPIIDKISKFEEILTNGQAILMDEVGNPLKKVESPGEYDSKDEVASVDNDMACSLSFERVGFGTQSLLEQWRDSYGNGDYDEDPYDDDMYKGQDLPQEIQAICDNLDIRVRGRKKK
ncbi:hypothetical protein Tco_1191305 [Tanacetum coccineum]